MGLCQVKEHIRLVFAQIRRPVKDIAAGGRMKTAPRIVAGGYLGCLKLVGKLIQRPELNKVIAGDARVGGQAFLVALHKIVDDVGAEFLLKLQDLMAYP